MKTAHAIQIPRPEAILSNSSSFSRSRAEIFQGPTVRRPGLCFRAPGNFSLCSLSLIFGLDFV
ncbi:hypothetical protein ACUUL3_08770 [Thiovibrio sp. JS02]